MLNYICHVDRDTHVAVQPSQAPPPQLSCWTGLGLLGEWLGSFLTTLTAAVANFGVLNALLLANSKAASSLQITFQRGQKKYRAKGYRHTPKPAEGIPTAPQGSR